MSKPLPSQNTFAALAPPWSLVSLDANFTNVWAAINDIGTYFNTLTDTGAVNALTANPAGGVTFALTTGIAVDVTVANTNTTTTPTLNVNSTGAKTIINSDGSALLVGALVATGIYRFVYDGTSWRVQGPSAFHFSSLTIGPPASGTALTVVGASGANTISANGFVVTQAGNVTIAPPSSGTAVTINSLAANYSLSITGPAGPTIILNSTNASGAYLTWQRSGTSLSDFGNSAQVFGGGTLDNIGLGTRGAQGLDLGTNGVVRVTVNSAGNVTVNAPAAGSQAINITGTVSAGIPAASIRLDNTDASPSALNNAHLFLDNANTTAGNFSSIMFRTSDNGGALHFGAALTVTGTNRGASGADQQVQVYTRTAAGAVANPIVLGPGNQIQGTGPVAGGLVDMTPDSSSWSSTLSGGFTANPSGTLKWRRSGNMVMITADAAITGTSNANTDISCSGLPAAITPTANRLVMCTFTNAGTTGTIGQATVQTGGTILLQIMQSGGIIISPGQWSNSAAKGITAGWTISYIL